MCTIAGKSAVFHARHLCSADSRNDILYAAIVVGWIIWRMSGLAAVGRAGTAAQLSSRPMTVPHGCSSSPLVLAGGTTGAKVTLLDHWALLVEPGDRLVRRRPSAEDSFALSKRYRTVGDELVSRLSRILQVGWCPLATGVGGACLRPVHSRLRRVSLCAHRVYSKTH